MTSSKLLYAPQNEKLNQVIDNVLNEILGRDATQIIYEYLATTHLITKNQIAEKLDSFTGALRDYLGAGAATIEELIRQNLEPSRLWEDNDLNFEKSRLLKLA